MRKRCGRRGRLRGPSVRIRRPSKRSEAMRAILPMTKQVLQNYERLGMKAAWTGPLARGDYEVVAKHVAALKDYSPEYCKAYEALNRLAERILPRDGEED